MAMHYHIEIRPKTLYFKKPAGTSRGTYTERKSWYIYLTAEEIPGRQGIGECAPLPKLSCDDVPGYEEVLAKACQNLSSANNFHLMKSNCVSMPTVLSRRTKP